MDKALSANKNDPATQRDVGYAFFETGLNKKKALKLTAKAAKGKKGALYHLRHAMVLADKKKTEFDALEAFSRGYKIQYRNEIEHNSPQYMAEYSYALFRISKMRYEEVVETAYHLNKAFPACKQLHYTIQGVAAAEAPIWSNPAIMQKSQ